MALEIEAAGETVGEAKWAALRELERLRPGLDKAAVRFQVVTEGERGLLGVGYEPARVVAALDEEHADPPQAEGPLAQRVREVLERISAGLGVDFGVVLHEEADALVATCSGPDLGRLIGRHGQTIDALQYLVNAIVRRAELEDRRPVIVDAAGYRARRQHALASLAVRTAVEVAASGREAELEPMTAIERKVVHLRLKDHPGVETRSEGTEPSRYVIIAPAEDLDEAGTDA
ncbi:MAG: RNA-binding cell elongation regulator Jag/EloR [Gaiellaceae bacterium]